MKSKNVLIGSVSVILCFAVLFSSVIFLYAQVPGTYKPPVVFKWLEKLEDGKKAAKDQSKPLCVFYYVEDEKDSRWMLTEGMEDKQVKQTLKDFVCVKINSTKEKRIFKKYPVVLFYSPSGKEMLIDRIVGLPESGQAWEINNALNSVASKTSDIINKPFPKFVSIARKQFQPGEKIGFKCVAIERGYSTVKVFDAKGVLIKTLLKSVKKADEAFEIIWDQKDSSGLQVASGNYIVIFELASFKDVQEVTVL